jgi:hypothetical protein
MAAAVVVEIFAGLGNQLFQYAAGYGLARLIGAELQVAPLSGRADRPFALDRFAFDLRPAPSQTPGQRLRERVSRRTGIPLPGLYVEKGFSFDEALLKQAAPIRIRGYFQSERYFAHVAGDVRRMVVLRGPLSAVAQRIADAIDHAPLATAVHVRRGDLAGSDARMLQDVLDPGHYRKANALLARLLGAEPHYFIFSDEPERAARDLDFLANRTIATAGLDRSEEDLMLMARCRHHIIANSTFSWWGAWLAASESQVVIAPRAWFRPAASRTHNTSDLFPEGWILI